MSEVRIDDLRAGDQVFSPAGRWETVWSVVFEPSSYLVRLYTDRTGSDYSWTLERHQELTTVTAARVRVIPTVRVRNSSHNVVAYIATDDFLRGFGMVTLADASPLGRGRGWEIRDRPTGGEITVTVVASKAAAVSLVRAAARAHAKALGLSVYRPANGADR